MGIAKACWFAVDPQLPSSSQVIADNGFFRSTLLLGERMLPDDGEVRITVVSGRDVSANFDMQSLASLLHGDQVRMKRSAHRVRFLHPKGWSYYATLRRKLRWHEGVV